jgi:Flp pilus assembly protein TadB
MACIHGNDPRSCIVCQTLAEVDTLSGKSSAGSGRARTAAPVDIVSRGDRTPAESGHHFGFHVAMFLAVLVAAAISVWFVAGVVFAFIRVFEVLLVAVVAGTLGYRVGKSRGRREHR